MAELQGWNKALHDFSNRLCPALRRFRFFRLCGSSENGEVFRETANNCNVAQQFTNCEELHLKDIEITVDLLAALSEGRYAKVSSDDDFTQFSTPTETSTNRFQLLHVCR